MAHQPEYHEADLNTADRPPKKFQPLEFSAPKTSSLWKFSALAMLASLRLGAQEPVNFEEHIKPILRSNCNQCHNPDKAKGGLDMSSYGALMKGGSSGAEVIAGDPDGSMMYLSMTHAKEPFMPKEGDKRPATELDLVKRWIAGGLIERRGGTARVAEKAKISFDASAMVGAKPAGPPPMPDFNSEPPGFVSERANAIHAMAASPWAPLVAVGGSRQVVLYNPDTSDLLATIPFPEGEPVVLRFSRNAKLLMCGGGVGGQSGRVVLWDVVTGERVAEVGDEYDTVLAADVRADQKLVALGGPARIVRVYNTSNGEKVYQIKKHTEWVTAIEFSPDGILLATGDRNGGLFIWEADGGQPFFDLAGHQGMITRVSWRGDGNALASSSEDGSVKLWNAHDGKLIKTITAHAGGVEAVEFARDGKLVTCGRDKTVKIWSTDGSLLKTISDFGEMATAVVATYDAARIVAGDWNGQVKVFATADGGFTGKLRANPPSLAAQILDAAAQREPAQKRVNDLKALADAANATAAQRLKELVDAQNNVTDKAAKVAASETALAAARKDVDEANAQLAAAKQELSNREADLAMRNERARQATERESKARGEKDELQRQVAEQSHIVEEMKKLVSAAQSAALPTPNDAAVFDQLENSARKQLEADALVASLNQRIPGATANLDKLVVEAKEANSVIKAGQDAVAGAKSNNEQKQNAANQTTAKKDEAEKSLVLAKAESEQAGKNANEKQNAVNDAKTSASNANAIAAAAQQDLVNADKRSDRLKAEQFDALVKKAEGRLAERGEGPFTLDQVVEAANKAVEEIQPVLPPKKPKAKDAEPDEAKRTEVPRALLFLGRFHMVLLHLPIGALLLALLLELDRLIRKTEQTDYIITQTLRFGAAFAVVSAILGYLLSLDSAYDPAEISRHKWLGIAATGAAVIAAWTRNHRHAFAPYVYWLTIVGTAVLLSLAGHDGGELTHGRDFLVKYYPDFASVFGGKNSADAADNSQYGRTIRPILERNCISCHGPKKSKGELRLDIRTKAFAGGESGRKAIVPGDALKSEIVVRMLLARDHEDVMPPSNKPAMKEKEIFAIIRWINEGAYWPDVPVAPTATNTVKAAAAKTSTNTVKAAAATNAPPPAAKSPTNEPAKATAPATNPAPAAAPAPATMK